MLVYAAVHCLAVTYLEGWTLQQIRSARVDDLFRPSLSLLRSLKYEFVSDENTNQTSPDLLTITNTTPLYELIFIDDEDELVHMHYPPRIDITISDCVNYFHTVDNHLEKLIEDYV
jgi:hypothetical protein